MQLNIFLVKQVLNTMFWNLAPYAGDREFQWDDYPHLKEMAIVYNELINLLEDGGYSHNYTKFGV